jgi:hypothetical protein
MKKYTGKLKYGMPVRYNGNFVGVIGSVEMTGDVIKVYHNNEWQEYAPAPEVKQMCFVPASVQADDIAEVLNVLWKAKAAKGALRSCDLVNGKPYYYIDGSSVKQCFHDNRFCLLEKHIFPLFDTEENCNSFINSVGGNETIKELLRKWHGKA